MNCSKYFTYFVILILSLLLSACDGFQEQIVPVNIPVDDVPTIVVINGEIEKDKAVWVQVSYSEDIDAPAGTPVTYEENATVILKSAAGEQEVLSYFQNGIYVGSSITGEVNETYTLTVDIEGQIYTATSTMFDAPGFQNAWVTSLNGSDGKEIINGYDEEWIVNDPSDSRNRYLFEWYTDGTHIVAKDWAIDDNRVVNVNEGLRLINPTISPQANQYTVLRASEIDKLTYDYFNMYEKIVRSLVGSDSQTPFNPVSNFGTGTMGNFRAVAFSSVALLTPPNLTATGGDELVKLSFDLNSFFTKYNLYWSNEPGVSAESDRIEDIQFESANNSANYVHEGLMYGATYYYRIQVEDEVGNTSVLSPEVDAVADTTSGNTSTNGQFNATAIAGNGAIILTWDDVPGADAYYIYWNTSPGIDESDKIIYETGLKSPYTHTGLTPGQTYYYRVGAKAGAEKYLSNEVSAAVN